ncbi:MAG TPA: DUF2244 domain-containing protein [Rhizomicrobium sp.]|jgi:uncharacterized membrane protein|nr:DUF2244 domain-containing protein [Rhizomicrobium sp.]
MEADDAHHPRMDREPLLLDTVLRPSPPMDARALLIILALVASFNAAFALSFILRGAWPVAPFMGLDVLLLAWAFRESKIRARRSEHVMLTRDELSVEQTPARGHAKMLAFNPYWVRVDLQPWMEVSNRLYLRSHGKSIQLGAFLAPAVRENFANRLKSALSEAKSADFSAARNGS